MPKVTQQRRGRFQTQICQVAKPCPDLPLIPEQQQTETGAKVGSSLSFSELQFSHLLIEMK